MMSQLQADDLVTATISVINIVTTIVLAVINLFFLYWTHRSSIRRDALAKYYFPIMNAISIVRFQIKYAYEQNPEFDLFNPNPEKEDDQINRRKIIDESYRSFLSTYYKLEPYCCYTKIDKQIFIAILHIQFMINTLGNEKMFDTNESKNNYPIPDYDDIIAAIKRHL